MLGVWGKLIPKASNERKTLAGWVLPYAKLRLLSHCAWKYLYPFGLCRCAITKKAGRKAGRKKVTRSEVYISRMSGATPSGQSPTKLGKCVCLTDVIKRAKSHHYVVRGFGAVKCWSVHVAIGTQAVLNTAWRYRVAGDRWTGDCTHGLAHCDNVTLHHASWLLFRPYAVQFGELRELGILFLIIPGWDRGS